MTSEHAECLRAVQSFSQLVKYLKEEMEWPFVSEDWDEISFEFDPEDIGIDPKNAAKIEGIRQLRPPTSVNWPWGIFFIKFEKKRLPVVALRKALAGLVRKQRESANTGDRQRFEIEDLLFISSYGEGEDRRITFASFHQQEEKKDLPTLKVLEWDEGDTVRSLDYVAGELRGKLKWPDDGGDDLEAWRERWTSAFTLKYRHVIKTSKVLAEELAKLAQNIRHEVNESLSVESEKGPFTRLMGDVKKALVHDLEPDGFADMYAQTIAYGLLSARLTAPSGGTADDLATAMPVTNPFIKELMETFLEVGGRTGKEGDPAGLDFDEVGVNEVVELLNAETTDMDAVLRDFDDKNPQQDPVIHFFEGFLQAYDKKIRKDRGVFYTPRPVVSFIVRSVDELLRTEFGLEDGLADTTTWGEMAGRIDDLEIPDGATATQAFVQILDPATGTGTFLVEVIDLIHKTMTAKWQAEGHAKTQVVDLWNKYVPEHLLPRLHGYELMMAPYAIAHMKIGLKLYETGYRFESEERARVFLTNALEPAQDFSGTLAFAIPALAHEAEAVNAIKRDQRFTVVVGNPPYSGISSNLTPELRAIVEPYRYVDGEKIHERGALQFEKNIQDDYVKFFALSEQAITATRFGVLALITNHGFLDTPTLRGMRWSLLQSFRNRYFLDLNGSTKRPISGDDNVFDIQQGVAISLLYSAIGEEATGAEVSLAELIGPRATKYDALLGESWSTIPCEQAPALPSLYQFLSLDANLKSEFESFTPLPEAMPVYSSGTETGFDSLLVDFTRGELEGKLRDFLDPEKSQECVKAEFGIGKGTALKLLQLRDSFRADFEDNGDKYITTGMYRLFDERAYYYKKEYLKTNSFKVMRNLIGGTNRALVAFRQQSVDGFDHAFITKTFGDKNAVSLRTREINYYFPLWILPETGSLLAGEPVANISHAYIRGLENALGGNALAEVSQLPEAAFNFIYGVLHSPEYRRRYQDFLKSEYPRLPVTSSMELFLVLSKLGEALASFHLLETHELGYHITTAIGTGEFQVEKVSYSDKTVWIDKAKTRGFKGVPEEVWNFHIGGYQVCEKWLKDRQAKGGKNPRPGRVLTDEDIEHYQKIVVALSETIRIMAEIDEVIEAHGGWPDAFQTGGDSEE